MPFVTIKSFYFSDSNFMEMINFSFTFSVRTGISLLITSVVLNPKFAKSSTEGMNGNWLGFNQRSRSTRIVIENRI